MPTNILIVVDPQKDFCEGGALPVTGGNLAMENLATHLRTNAQQYTLIAVSQDWHTPDDDNNGHITENPDYVNTWPAHGIAYTEGAEIHPAVASALPPDTHRVIKGMGEPAYSAFNGIVTPGPRNRPGTLENVIRVAKMMSGEPFNIDIAGLATDYCVKETALDAKRLFPHANVTVHTTLSAGVGEVTTLAAVEAMRAAGIVVK